MTSWLDIGAGVLKITRTTSSSRRSSDASTCGLKRAEASDLHPPMFTRVCFDYCLSHLTRSLSSARGDGTPAYPILVQAKVIQVPVVVKRWCTAWCTSFLLHSYTPSHRSGGFESPRCLLGPGHPPSSIKRCETPSSKSQLKRTSRQGKERVLFVVAPYRAVLGRL